MSISALPCCAIWPPAEGSGRNVSRSYQSKFVLHALWIGGNDHIPTVRRFDLETRKNLVMFELI